MQPVIGLVFFYNGTKEEGLKGFKAFDGISERLFSVCRQHSSRVFSSSHRLASGSRVQGDEHHAGMHEQPIILLFL